MIVYGEKNPIIGIEYKYWINDGINNLGINNQQSDNYCWKIYLKQKNGQWKDVTKNGGKIGKEVNYTFTQVGVEYRLDVFKIRYNAIINKIENNTFLNSFYLIPTAKESKPKIVKVALYNKGAQNVNLVPVTGKLTVKVNCVGLFNKRIKIHVWREDSTKEENSKTVKDIAVDEKGLTITEFNVIDLFNGLELAGLMTNLIKEAKFFVTASHENLSITNKVPVVYTNEINIFQKVDKTGKSVATYNDIDTPEKPKEKKCFCNRDFKESDVKEFIKFLKGRETIWEGYKDAPCNIDDKSFATLTKDLNAMFKKYKINHCAQKLHFLAQACHETDTFTLSEETFGSEASSQSIYKGRGILQLTGVRKNGEKYYDLPGPYETYSDYIGINAIRNPQIIAEQIKYCLDSGGWMFSVFKKMPSDPNAPLFNERWKGHKENTIGKSLNELALFGDKYLELISALLNGRNPKTDMPNGWSKRKMNYDLLKTVFFNYDFFHNKKQEIEKTKSNDKWRNPIDNPMLCLYSQGGGEKAWHGSFGEKIRDNSVNHSGCDLFALPETPVYACIKGKIDRVYTSTTLAGNTVVIKITDKETFNSLKRSYTPLYKNKGEILEKGFDLNKSIYLVFMHLSKFGKFKTGDIVEYSDIIGYSGISGKNGKNFTTRNPHLHFEINNVGSIGGLDGKCNPMLYFKFKTENELSETEKNNQLTAKNKEWS